MPIQNHQSPIGMSKLPKSRQPHLNSVEESEGFAEVLAQAPSFPAEQSASRASLPETALRPLNGGSNNDSGLRVRVVASLLSGEIPVDQRHLQIDVHQSVVTLRGFLATKRQQQLAIHLVLLIREVTKVVDYSQVGESPAYEIVSIPTWNEWMTSHYKGLTATVAMLFVFALIAVRSNPGHGTPVFPVAGKIRVEGRIPSGAFIVLHPVTKGASLESLPRGVVGSDGLFHIGTFQSADGAPLGEYVVTVEWRPLIRQGDEAFPGPNVLPLQYSNPETSLLRVRITKGKNELDPILLFTSPRALNS